MVKPRLIFVIDSIFPSTSGGREALLYALCRELQSEWEIIVIAMKTRKPEFHPLSTLKVELVRLPAIALPPWGLFARWGFIKLLSFAAIAALYLRVRYGFSRRPTAFVVLNPAHLYSTIFLFRRQVDRRVIWTHGNLPLGLFPDMPRRRKFFEAWQASSCFDAELVLACGSHNFEEMKPISRNIFNIPNFIDYDSFAEGDEKRDRSAIAFVSTLSEDRGTLELIEALHQVMGQVNRPFRAFFVGSGDLVAIEARLRERGLGNSVQLIGESKDVARILRKSTISICIQNPHLVGRGGGISVASIESMAAGTAVIAWDTPQYRQVIEHMRTGYLVPVGDTAALAQAIVRLLADVDLAWRLGNAAREEAKIYDARHVASIFSSLVGSKWSTEPPPATYSSLTESDPHRGGGWISIRRENSSDERR